MHYSSRLKFECFVDTYMKQADGLSTRSILDVGSRKVQARAYCHRDSLKGLGIRYTGLDLEAGINVDIVPRDPYVWEEIGDESYDFVVSGQTFEHNPFMWVTASEIARVLKPDGVAFVAAPSAGAVHRFPFDCWRYYPDSWAALAALTGLHLVESIREPSPLASQIEGGRWMDAVGIFRKQRFDSDNARNDFYGNLALIVAPFKTTRYDVIPAKVNEGPCFDRYVQMAKQAGHRLDPEKTGPPKGKPAMVDRRAPADSSAPAPRPHFLSLARFRAAWARLIRRAS